VRVILGFTMIVSRRGVASLSLSLSLSILIKKILEKSSGADAHEFDQGTFFFSFFGV
jgi:hypothetical protein